MITPNEYQDKVLRTVPESQQYWTGVILPPESDEPRKMLMANCALGLCGEIQEFLESETVDEGGDCYWYLAAACKAVGIEMSEIDPLLLATRRGQTVCRLDEDPEDLLREGSAKFAEMTKKYAFHGRGLKDLERSMLDALERIADGLALSVARLGDPGELSIQVITRCWEQNIQKLEARYPDGFPTQ